MNNYTLNQKYAIISILTQIMEADAVIHPNEIEYMDSIYHQLMITAQDLELMDHLEPTICLQIVQNMPNEQKCNAINFFHTMMAIDGDVDPREVAIINSL